MLSDTQIREAFHFAFLERLLKISDPGIYVLKGGVNLRFYFRSPRYSEDMDLDVLAGGVATLKKNGYKILQDASFQRSLRVFDIDAIDINDPHKAKHTDTTQRFRCSLVLSSGQSLPTKIECSRRADEPGDEAVAELLDSAIARRYRKLAFRCRHYSGHAAAMQKVDALAGRTVTQARDVFDLGILIRGGYRPDFSDRKASRATVLARAVECLATLTWEDYEGQVLEFLDIDSGADYRTPAEWKSLKSTVLTALRTND